MEKQNITTGFQQVDNSQHQFLAKFLEDVAALPVFAEGFGLQLTLLDIRPGDNVLDVGCGIGLQALTMAKMASPSGKVVGTDISTMMIDIARSRTANSGLPLEFLVADACSQPFPDQSFDCVRTERVLMYLPDTQQAIKEFKRLLKPGGRLVIFDFDWDGILIAHRDKALTRQIIRYASDSFPNGRIGADLYLQLRNAGFKNVEVRPSSYYGNSEILLNIMKRVYEGILQTGVANNVFTQTAIDNWWQGLDEDAKSDNFFMSFQGFIGYGTNEYKDLLR
ncbi:methyltransferase domain-containing protein [Pinibacter soli]|uniref:Methyltransferase domain-containing protein n=1 Tax=Pinibacter soli TaxID=3044211 RepID=A0ABT6REG1_9BACT|nr:methyltransferase domain-containing protein [Pinibacter soli]MDI3320960.1 methyltransferase domain-containing protein [Pinibacter soli]